jgi:hypothetical protein
MTRPPLGLSVNVRDANGVVTRWGSDDAHAENRPRNLSFGTQRMQGFGAGAVNLARRIDRDYVDASLYDSVEFVGDDGSTAYEGRVGAMPRSMDDRHTLSLQLAGWMAHASDRTFSQVFVDRDFARWHAVGTNRRIDVMGVGFGQVTDATISPDASRAALRTGFVGPWLAAQYPLSETWYDAGPGNNLARLTATWTRGTNIGVDAFGVPDANWLWQAALSSDDRLIAYDPTGDLAASGPGTVDLVAVIPRRYAMLQLFYGAGPVASDGVEYGIDWSDVALYGDHALPLLGTAAPYGVSASDVVAWIAGRYCPLLKTTGVQQTTYAIPHLVVERAKPYDAFLTVNAFHLWDLSVWENRTLYYGPTDYTDYDWEVRLDDYGTSVSLQGDSTEDLANGIVVKYTNLTTREADVLTPDTNVELRDDSVENPANQHGLQVWTDFELSAPMTADAALQMGRAALAEFNQPKAPGSISAGPYVRDRAGHWQAAWRVRAGDRVAITSSTSLSDRPRVIHSTEYDHDARQVTMAVDSTMRTLPAVLDRIQTALAANNLGG